MISTLAFLLLQASHGPAPDCERVAQAARESALAGARADFWLSVARALDGPPEELRSALRDAWTESGDARLLAERQFAARRELCAALGHGSYRPDLDPADFSADVHAVWAPLRPGRTLVYEGATPDGLERITIAAQAEPARVAGFPCRTVECVETLDGALVEATTEWFSLRSDGSVWYFGEISREYEDGLLASLAGSWRAGDHGARPGVLLPAQPALGALFRTEYLLGVAEDAGRVVATDQTVTVPAGTFHGCVGVEEWSPLEPDDVVVKYYAPGVGWVLEVDSGTGARMELVRVE